MCSGPHNYRHSGVDLSYWKANANFDRISHTYMFYKGNKKLERIAGLFNNRLSSTSNLVLKCAVGRKAESRSRQEFSGVKNKNNTKHFSCFSAERTTLYVRNI
jgi:hypothetical protein